MYIYVGCHVFYWMTRRFVNILEPRCAQRVCLNPQRGRLFRFVLPNFCSGLKAEGGGALRGGRGVARVLTDSSGLRWKANSPFTPVRQPLSGLQCRRFAHPVGGSAASDRVTQVPRTSFMALLAARALGFKRRMSNLEALSGFANT